MASLAAALVEAQKKMPAVAKSATANTGVYSYSYATLDALIAGTRSVLNDNGLAIAQFPSETSTGGPGLRTVLLHAESGESIEATVPLLLNGKHDMQALGGAITYARRYGWAAVLGIANDEDDDGQQVSAPAPRSGASQDSKPADGGQMGAEATAAASAPTFTPPEGTASMSPSWTWPFGKHKGKTLDQTDAGYLDWFLKNSDKEDIKQRVAEYLNLQDLEQVADQVDNPDHDIPWPEA